MLGLYENFPLTIHQTETFATSLSKRGVQQKSVQALETVNARKYSFEEIGNPSVPEASVIFEFGFAEEGGFTFLNPEEAKRIQAKIETNPLNVMDLFCAIRYYKNGNTKTPLKFDYYLVRINFATKGIVEFVISHERGPRYISPLDLVEFLERKINQTSTRKVLKPTEQD
jgi:hypothetical protein